MRTGLPLLLVSCAGPDVSVGARANLAPAAAIVAPVDGQSFTELDVIELVGTVADGDGLGDVQSVVWSSSLSGEIGEVTPDDAGVVRLVATLPAGTHGIALTVTDRDGVAGEDAVGITVTEVSTAPLADITSPEDDSRFAVGSPVTFVGGVADPNQDPETLIVAWTAEPTEGGATVQLGFGNPGLGGSTSASWSEAPVGEHRVTLAVTDDEGNEAEDTVIVDIFDPMAEDDDGDGASELQGDCDDDDPLRSPDFLEACNGIDDDCSGVVDDKDLDFDTHEDVACDLFPGIADDCDDENGDVHPGAPEDADGVDDDCDGQVDEATDRWDDDGDCFCEGPGPCNGSVAACAVLGVLDCDDSTVSLSPADDDGDGASTCTGDCDDADPVAHPFDGDLDGLSPCGGDCDDGDDAAGPGAPEVVADGVDQNCDGVDDCFRDTDLDGAGSAAVIAGDDLDCGNTAGEARAADDCDDVDADRHPGALEIPADGVDQDCDGTDDCWSDADDDGYGTADVVFGDDLDCADAGEAPLTGDCADGDPTRHPGAFETVADGIDQDCDGADACFVDADHDGVGGTDVTAAIAGLGCDEVVGLSDRTGDCDDDSVGRSPDVAEVVADGIDQDCDGLDACYQDNDLDGYGSAVVLDAADCTAAGRSDRADDCDDTEVDVHPGAPDTAGDGVDQNCDGVDACFLDADLDGWGGATVIAGDGLLCDGFGESPLGGDCADDDAALNPADEDDDGWSTCDGDCDDADDARSPADGDSDGTSGCDGDCDDADGAVGPDETDLPDASFVDTDCDGIDGDADNSVFVAPFGVDVGDCTSRDNPCATPNYAIDVADSLGIVDVLLVAGTYAGVVDIDSQTAWLWGGYDADWQRADRAVPGHLVVLSGGTSVDGQAMAVRGRNAVVGLADLQVDAPDAVGSALLAGKTSYGVHVVDSELTLERCEVVQGAGTAALAGATGADADPSAAGSGTAGGAADQFFDLCDTGTSAGGVGATNAACTGTNAGNGGASGAMDTSCGLFGFCSNCDATAGSAGGNATTLLGGVYGDGGDGGGTCTAGADGLDGRIANGASGAKGVVGGFLSGDYWVGDGGNAGAVGEHGGGGGGGGGSGGCDNGIDTDTRGAGGGGGGAGGCRASAGSGGGAGGGSFGVFAIDSDVEVRTTTLLRGVGGAGGAGGGGGKGQPGGAAGSGGAADSGTGPGGDGGKGGHGGHGGGGGGGAGGSVFGIYTYASTLVQVGNTFSGGAAGPGGAGGLSAPTEFDGNDGVEGDDGALGTIGACVSAGAC